MGPPGPPGPRGNNGPKGTSMKAVMANYIYIKQVPPFNTEKTVIKFKLNQVKRYHEE